jgi:hypothetical protein
VNVERDQVEGVLKHGDLESFQQGCQIVYLKITNLGKFLRA